MVRMCEQFCPVNSVRQEVPTEYFECRENRINCNNYNRNHNCIRQVQKSLLTLCLFATTMASPTGSTGALQAVSQGAQLFSTNFVKTVAKEQQGNLISSPLSADIALSMAATGAAGSTETQFRDVLNLPSKPQTLTGYQNLIDTLNNVENVTLKLANKMFIGKDFPVKPQYKQDLQTYYRSDIESVDFSQSAKAADTINTWSREKTNNRIDNIVQASDLDPSLALVLANAVYFKGNWAHQFDSAATTDRPFHVNANTVKQVPTMYRKGNYKYVELPEYEVKCIELPYANKEVSMVIILPDKVDGLPALIEKLQDVSTECSVRLAQTYEREVRVYLPKFKTESKLDLGDTLSQKMGLSEPFSNAANFNGISDVRLKIDKVVQKAFIEVNEEGSEAAAVTVQLLVDKILILPISPPKMFSIDHPFAYLIVKKDGNSQNLNVITLFNGLIYNP
ncbi:serine protease inhibitor 3/4-like isoform X5 [Nylanderia fulva]|uniref:serine protease inhibitor 3/4-like isoform X5 n=1 Tax=Nylanderia fulva TaxID=613905 RepID=UPI0010FB29F1|nr:serine protease inhibitor 3/4-like isoform X5 [Nylanderia fulva]